MKRKSFLLAFLMVFAFGLTSFFLVGCGQVSANELTTSFTNLKETYSSNAEVFTQGNCEGLLTKYLVSYDGKISLSDSKYKELKTVYNLSLAAANEYIDDYESQIINLVGGEKALTKSQKNSVKEVNSALKNTKKSLDNFILARENFLQWIEDFSSLADQDSLQAHLKSFKQSYGDLIEDSVDTALKISKLVEESYIFEMIEKTEPLQSDAVLIKDQIKIQLLPVYTQFIISEIDNNINWTNPISSDAEGKKRVGTSLDKIKELFAVYKTNFLLKSDTSVKELSQENIKTINSILVAFSGERDAYLKALEGLNIKKFSTLTYQFDLEKYKKSNSLAEIYLEKIENFSLDVLVQFLNQISVMLYN